MNIILNEQTASFRIFCPWEDPANRIDKYAKAKIHQVTKKRRRSFGSTSSVIQLSISTWTPSRVSDSSFTGKSFQTIFSYETKITAARGNAQILSVADAFENTSLLKFTWMVVGLKGNDNTYSIFILQVTEKNAILYGQHQFSSTPSDVVILRGPKMLVLLQEKLFLVEFDSSESIPKVVELFDINSQFRVYCICRNEHDGQALAFVESIMGSDSHQFSVVTLSHHGKSITSFSMTFSYSGAPSTMVGSLHLGIVILANSDGLLRSIDLKSGSVLWQTQSTAELIEISNLSLFENILLLTGSPSNNLFRIPIVCQNDQSSKQHKLYTLFCEPCEGMSSANHDHFYAPWRDCILQINDKIGTCCSDHKYEKRPENASNFQLNGVKPLTNVTHRLEKRVRDGIKRLLDEAERREDKEQMLTSLCGLLSNMNDLGSKAPMTNVFHNRLSNVALSIQHKSSTPMDVIHSDGDDNHPADPAMDRSHNSTVVSELPRFVKLIESKCCLNYTGQFIEVIAHVKVLPPEIVDSGEELSLLSIRLSVETNEKCSILWDTNVVKRVRGGDETWLGASCPVETVIANCRSVSESQLTVKIKSDRNHSQILQSYQLASILTNKESGLSSKIRDGTCMSPYQRQIHFIAEGPCAHHLDKISIDKQISCPISIETTENLAYITLTVASRLELIMAVAQLRAASDDRIKWRLVPKLSQTSLSAIDEAILSINHEMNLTNTIATEISKGRLSDQIQQLFATQYVADNAFGHLEELLLRIL